MIDDIYIKEAVRIRKEYLENLSKVNVITDEYSKLLLDLEDVKNKLDNISEKHLENVSEKQLKEMLDEIHLRTKKTFNTTKPYTQKTKELDKQQSLLYNKIKEKYPDLSDEDLYSELIPIIQVVDEEFDF